MYLFDKKEKSVNVYKMELDPRTAAIFRQQEMTKIADIKCFKFETCKINKNLGIVFEHQRNQVIDVPLSKLQYDKKIFANYHSIKPGDNSEQVMDKYYNGLYNDANIVRVYDYDEAKLKLKIVRYFLVNQGYKKILSGEGFLNGVVSIPETLYFFELLQKGRFDCLDSIDISTLLGLFDICPTPVDEISLDSSEKLDYYGCGTTTKDKLIEKVNGSQKIVQIARKQGRII